jgi:hypothetical protein
MYKYWYISLFFFITPLLLVLKYKWDKKNNYYRGVLPKTGEQKEHYYNVTLPFRHIFMSCVSVIFGFMVLYF